MILPLLAPVLQWILFVGVSVTVGCVAWRLVVAPGAARQLSSPQHHLTLARAEHRVARTGVVAALLLLGVWILRMVDQVIRFRDPFVPLREDVSFLLFETFWGTVWMAQGALIPLLVVAFWRAAAAAGRGETAPAAGLERPSLAWRATALLVMLLVATLALSSHAMGVETWKPLIVAADGVHALAAGTWIGTLALILSLGRPAAGGPHTMEPFAAQIRSFSPMAVLSVGALLSMGVVLSWTHLTAVSDLWLTGYGRILVGKVVLALGVLVVGFINWRKGVPGLITDSAAGETHRRATMEVTLATGVLVLTAILVHSVKP